MERIPLNSVFGRLDALLGRGDAEGAEKHILYWLAEAERLSDKGGKFALLNELIGFYRKTNRRDEALNASEQVLELADRLGIVGNVQGATAYLNAATAYSHFGEPEAALQLYGTAREIYEKELNPADGRLAALYNNMASAHISAGDLDEAGRLYLAAAQMREKAADGGPEAAVSYANLAELEEQRHGIEAGEAAINGYLEKAEALLEARDVPQDQKWAFDAEKCVPAFKRYGFFAFAAELEDKIDRIRGMK